LAHHARRGQRGRLCRKSSARSTGGDAPRRDLLDWGAQLNVRMVLWSSLESTLSLGWAQALEEGARPEDELMVSLKILR